MPRCNCPHYNIPSADPNDSKGCPVHDPDYVDPQVEIRALKAKIAELEVKPLYICGMFDEHEFMGQMPPHYGEKAYGPYDTPEEAQAVARTLSSDPDEAIVLELVYKDPPS